METMQQVKVDLTQKYDLLAKKFHEEYLAGKERGSEAMTSALEKAHLYLFEAEEFNREQGNELKEYMSRDLNQTIDDIEQLGESAKEHFNPSRLGAGALASLAAILNIADSSLHSLSKKTNKKLSYKTGEITTAGTLTCLSCEQKVHLKSTGHIPPCPKCKATKFSKGY